MLKIIEILIYSFIVLLTFYFYFKRPPAIGCFYLEYLFLLSLFLIIYLVAKNSFFPLLTQIILIVIILLLAGTIFLFFWIPHYTIHKKYMERHKGKLEFGAMGKELTVPSSTKYTLWAFNIVILPVVYWLFYISEKIPFQGFIEFPFYSKLIIAVCLLIFIILCFVGKRK